MNWQERFQQRSVYNTWSRRFSSTEFGEVVGDGKGQLDGISPSAFSDGEVLWADGKPIKNPSYTIGDEEVRTPAGGPLPLSRDLNKDAQSSTITGSDY